LTFRVRQSETATFRGFLTLTPCHEAPDAGAAEASRTDGEEAAEEEITEGMISAGVAAFELTIDVYDLLSFSRHPVAAVYRLVSKIRVKSAHSGGVYHVNQELKNEPYRACLRICQMQSK
jgi:hypothetical protein